MKKHNMNINDELKDIDRKLASLIAKRSGIIGRLTRIRQQNHKSFSDPELEKELWGIWKDSLKRSNQSILRRMFTMLNSLAYSMAEKGSSDKPFCLYPTGRPVSLNLPAPGSVDQTHYTAFLFAICTDKTELAGFTINDNIIELIKIANECGGGLNWNDNLLTSQDDHVLDMDNRNLFINHSLFNFYLFLCLALGAPNRIKFNSSARLKVVDLKWLQDFLPQLGARLNSIEPGSFSLPARLETGAVIPAELYIPASIHADFVKALLLAAFTYEKPITFNYSAFMDNEFNSLFSVLSQAGVVLEHHNDRIVIHPSKPKPQNIAIPADPLLSGFLLAMAGLSKGRVELQGVWPANCPQADKVLQILKVCGVQVHIHGQSISAQVGSLDPNYFFDFTSFSEQLPLALPLALASVRDRQADMLVPPSSPQLEIFADILDNVGYAHEVDYVKGRLKIYPRNKNSTKDQPWNSPDPYWTLGYCLLSFKDKGICLANPGIITSIWPGFWKIFTNLSGVDKSNSKNTGDAPNVPKAPVRRKIVD
ncbi:hypothetical protein [Desulfonatronovibrio magnus]|uniref:hypothetical protein n=1 Tax=Desulfonatronovibrio magnus TaxID=698827 RepID=UPI0005EB83A4|nr:hypothetical protein [Desulfonatronovibrio magnus]